MNITEGIKTALTGSYTRPKPEEALKKLAELYKNGTPEDKNSAIAIENLALDLQKIHNLSEYKLEQSRINRDKSFKEIYQEKYIQDLIHEEILDI